MLKIVGSSEDDGGGRKVRAPRGRAIRSILCSLGRKDAETLLLMLNSRGDHGPVLDMKKLAVVRPFDKFW